MTKESKKFILSTDTCSDYTKSELETLGVYYIIMKRIVDGKEIAEIFDTDADFDNFYAGIKENALPTTVQVNPFEFKEYFESLLAKEKSGDIIHIALSSGLSGTFNNAVLAAEEVNRELKNKGDDRKVYAVDSLSGTLPQGIQVEKMAGWRDEGMDAETAIEKLQNYLSHQHGWVVVSDLFHLKRGGRISGAKAAIGTILNIKPIIHLNDKGKLAIENKVRGNQKAVKYLLSRLEKFGEKADKEFTNAEIWIVRTSNSDLYELFKSTLTAAYPKANFRYGIVGPIIGTHLGCDGIGLLFNAHTTRLTVS